MSFIKDYLFMVENTKPPKVFQIWSMLATLSAFAGRRFWFPFGPKRYYPNLYVILVGDPGIAKSTCMERSMDLVRESKISPISGTRITKEALMKRMSSEKFEGRRTFSYNNEVVEYNQYAIYATEFVDFLGMDAQGFLDFLTAAWDQPVIDNETKHQGQDVVIGPHITLLGCMTPEKLKGYMKLSILTGGFARRCAFVYSSEKHIIHWPSFSDEQKAARERLIAFGVRLQKFHGQFDMTPECRKFYEDWNTENETKMTDQPPTCRGWFESKGEMLFKLSMLVALAESESLLIDVAHYRVALRFCSMLETNLPRVFEGAGLNPNAGPAAQICRMLEAMPRPMNRKSVEALFFDQSTDIAALRSTIDHLVAVGRLAERQIVYEGKLLGTIIGTPAVVAASSDETSRTALTRPSGLGVVQDTGLNSSASPGSKLVEGLEG